MKDADLYRADEMDRQGIANVNASPLRLDVGRKAFKRVGVKIKDTYLTMGRYDLVCVMEAPDDETYATAMLTLAPRATCKRRL